MALNSRTQPTPPVKSSRTAEYRSVDVAKALGMEVADGETVTASVSRTGDGNVILTVTLDSTPQP
jgi:hypothetical protein